MNSTTSERRRARRSTSPTSSRPSLSTRAGSSSAIASTSRASSSPRPAPSTEARTCRSSASRSTRSPARVASAASSSAASSAASSRGTSPDPARRRAAGVDDQQHPPVALRPPGAHDDALPPGRGPPVDRADVVAGDVVAQRVELGALPPDVRRGQPVQLAQPGQPLGQEAPARRRPAARAPRQGTSCRPCRAATPSGPSARTVTRSGRRSPRRVGCSVVVDDPLLAGAARRPPGSPGSRRPRATQASRSTARSRRPDGLATVSRTCGRLAEPDRRRCRRRCSAQARDRSGQARASTSTASAQQGGDGQHGREPRDEHHGHDPEQGQQRRAGR